jgi:hypothetical protein
MRSGYGFCVIILRYFLRESCRLSSINWQKRIARECKKFSFKKYKNWCKKLVDFDVPNKIQSKEYSMGGGADGFLHENTGVLWAVNCNWNDDGWNVNANSVENPNSWNDGNMVFF